MDVFALALRVIFSLGVVLAVLWFVQRRYARATGLRGKAADPISVVSRRGIGQKAAIVVVDMGGKRFMLGVTDQAVNVLHSEDAPAAEPATETAAQAFSRTLAAVPGGEAVNDPATPRRHRKAQAPGLLEGSILLPSTWARAGQALSKGLKG